jgi:hypothetical protein
LWHSAIKYGFRILVAHSAATFTLAVHGDKITDRFYSVKIWRKELRYQLNISLPKPLFSEKQFLEKSIFLFGWESLLLQRVLPSNPSFFYGLIFADFFIPTNTDLLPL